MTAIYTRVTLVGAARRVDFAEAEQVAADDGLPLRPKPARIRQDDEPETPEHAAVRQRLQYQVLQRRAGK